ncbi:MAG: ACT domain-containing protein, partial [Paracoccaceae bacterium]|nr:ACT domain-containing protein [Paracoccaceae bacterium]
AEGGEAGLIDNPKNNRYTVTKVTSFSRHEKQGNFSGAKEKGYSKVDFDRLSNSSRETKMSEDELNGLTAGEPLAGDDIGVWDALSGHGISLLEDLLRGLDPYQRPGVWVYAELPRNTPCPEGAAFTVIEDEGRTVVLPEDEAKAAGLQPLFRAAWITLRVHSALEAFGLVAQVSSRLADVAIPCNIIAGARHDHILVPYDKAEEALRSLRDLQTQA